MKKNLNNSKTNAPMVRVTFNRLSKKKASFRRKRASTLTKAKYAPKTTRVNRSLIKSNALAIRAIKRMIPKAIFTDYQYSFTQEALLSSDPSGLYQSIASNQLMSPVFWSPVLRQDENVIDSSATRVLRLQANMRYILNESSTVQITTFIVSIRKDAVNRQINDTLVEGQDYIFAKGAAGAIDLGIVPRLNPAVFKVLYTRNVTLMSNGFLQPIVDVNNNPLVSNSSNTMRKGQVNLKLNFNIRQPVNGDQWKNMQQSQFGPTQRLFLLTFFRGITAQPDDNAPRLDCDALYTCYNAS